ncbi:MAG: DUF2189 domain-containing protein [Betaproteobacteria bacterium]|nr:DUF2189 domain-containing protein [Betaproteobacteria bacterium]
MPEPEPASPGPAPPPAALFDIPPIRTVDALRALVWLQRGAADIAAQPWPSLFYGLCFAGMGGLLLVVFRFAIDYTSTLAMGFMLAGPVLAIGLYDLSRQREELAGPPGRVRLLRSLVAWRHNPGGIGIYVLILTIAFLVWARASMVTFALFEARALPTWSAFFVQLASMQNLAFVAAFFGVGMLFALLVFVLSAVSIPFLYDRRTDAVTAAAVSVTAVAKNPVAMTVWAVSIVMLVGAGLATLYIGLVFTGPLIGHATWHAYRDLVAP